MADAAVFGTVRTEGSVKLFDADLRDLIVPGVDVTNFDGFVAHGRTSFFCVLSLHGDYFASFNQEIIARNYCKE